MLYAWNYREPHTSSMGLLERHFLSAIDTVHYKYGAAGPVAKVWPVRPWPYRFLREKKWHHLDSNLRMRYGVASPSSSP